MKNIKKTIHDLLKGKNTIHDLFKGKNTILIESMCKDAKIYVNRAPLDLEYQSHKKTNTNIFDKQIILNSLTFKDRVDFDADIFIRVSFGYEGEKYEKVVHTTYVDVRFRSKVRITRVDYENKEVKTSLVQVRATKAIKRAIENLILNQIVIK
jgi:hypothetical protein